jgi:Skp family chaperone for outer membrane proteins
MKRTFLLAIGIGLVLNFGTKINSAIAEIQPNQQLYVNVPVNVIPSPNIDGSDRTVTTEELFQKQQSQWQNRQELWQQKQEQWQRRLDFKFQQQRWRRERAIQQQQEFKIRNR